MSAKATTILYAHGGGSEDLRLPSPSALLKTRFRILSTDRDDAVAVVRRTAPDDQPEAVVLDLRDLPEEEALRLAGGISRGTDAVVVTRGAASASLVLELVAVGVTDHVPAEASPEHLAARLLLALDRRTAERDLHRGYVAFRSIFDKLEIPIAITDAEGRFQEANPAFHALLGYGREALARLTVPQITHPEDADTLQLLRELAEARRDSYRVRKRYLTVDGGTVWCDTSVSRFHDPIADDVRLIAELEDVTRQIETREQLATTRLRLDASREGYRLLFEHTPLPILVLDLDAFRFAAANPAAAELFGYSREELLELAPERLWERPEQMEREGRRLLSAGDDLPTLRVRLRHRLGHVLEVEVTSAHLEHEGRAARVLLLREEGSRERSRQPFDRAREAVSRQQAADEAAARLSEVGERISRCAEELAAHLEDEPGQALLQSLREVADDAGRQAERFRQGRGAPGEEARASRQPVAAGNGTEDAAGLPNESRTATTESEVAAWNRATGRAAFGRAAPRRAAPRTAAAERTETGGPQAAGTEPLGSITERMAIAERALEAGLAGDAKAPAKAALDSTTLNAAADRAADTAARDTAHRFPGAAAAEPPVEVRRARILVVDDDDAVRFVISEMLQLAGHTVVAVGTAEAALERLGAETGYDLVITDATLPGLSSGDLMKRLDRGGGPAVLVVSGYLNDTLAARGLLGRDVPFLAKPFTAAELSAKLEEILRATATADPPLARNAR